MLKEPTENRSKYWDRLCDILETEFPKGLCGERGEALVLLAYAEMFLVEQERNFEKEKRNWLKELKQGNICLSCGGKKEGKLTDWCDKCLENN